ncbi:head-tail joining protein [Hydrogenimonas sp.]
MNSFTQDIEEDIQDVFLDTEEFARNVVIDNSEIPAIFSRDNEAVLEGNAIDGVDYLIAKRSDVAGENPAISIDGTPYTVIKIEDDHSGMVKIYISKDDRPRF